VSIIRRSTRKETRATESTTEETIEQFDSKEEPRVEGAIGPRHSRATCWSSASDFYILFPPTASGNVGGVVQSKVFANGRQQVHIKVIISPRLDGEFVSVPASELAERIRLVRYDGGGVVPSDWYLDVAEDRTYKYDGSVIPGPQLDAWSSSSDDDAPVAENTVTVDLWIRTTATSAETIAVAITPPLGSEITTAASGFNSGVNIYPATWNLGAAYFHTTTTEYNHSGLEYFTVWNKRITFEYPNPGQKIDLLRIADSSSTVGGYVNVYADDGETKDRSLKKWEGMFTTCLHETGEYGREYFFDVPDFLTGDLSRREGAEGQSRGVTNISVYGTMGRTQTFEAGAINFLYHVFDEHRQFYWSGKSGEKEHDANDVNRRNVILRDVFGNDHRLQIGSVDNGVTLDFGVIGKW
jgi:hypothetical protein